MVSCVARSYNGFVEIDEDTCSFAVTVTAIGLLFVCLFVCFSRGVIFSSGGWGAVLCALLLHFS